MLLAGIWHMAGCRLVNMLVGFDELATPTPDDHVPALLEAHLLNTPPGRWSVRPFALDARKPVCIDGRIACLCIAILG
jgi:hypothetical protein